MSGEVSLKDRVVVLGGGAAGAAAAILLARAGRRVTLIEHHREARHKVCGEFLSTEACASLAMLGVDLVALGAVPIDTIRLAGGGATAEDRLPFRAMSVTRKRLDEALLEVAAGAGVEVVRGFRAESVSRNPGSALARTSWRVQLSSGESLETGDLFVATGKHDLRGHARPPARGARLVAFKQYFRLATGKRAALAGAVELTLFDGGYAGLQMVEDGVANLCLLIEERRLRALGGNWPGLFSALCAAEPQLRMRLHGAETVLPQPLALSHIPYGFLAQPADTFWRIGDQAAVIPSFTGDGISIALHTARIAALCYLSGGSPADAIVQMRRDVRGSMSRAGLLAQLLLARPTQRIALWVARAWPKTLTMAAATTRIPTAARTQLRGRERASAMHGGAYNEQG